MLPAILLLAIIFGSSCTARYARNRARDAADIFTVEVQTQSYGVSARVGPLKAGLNYKSPRGFSGGLRGGHFGRFYSAEFTALLFGADYFGGKIMKDLDPPKKKPKSETAEAELSPADATRLAPDIPGLSAENQNLTEYKPDTGADPPPGEEPVSEEAAFTVAILEQRRKEYRARSPFGTLHSATATKSLLKDKRTKFSPLHYYTQVEVTVGLWGGLKLGVNFGELLDFLLGFVGIDIMKDDEPFLSPQLEKLKNSPLWKRLDDKTKQELMRQQGGPPGL